MRKLELRIETLTVESFDTGAAEARRGTVAARESAVPTVGPRTGCVTENTFCPCSEFPTRCPCAV